MLKELYVTYILLKHPTGLSLPVAKRIVRQVPALFKPLKLRVKYKLRTRINTGPLPGTFEDQRAQLKHWADTIRLRPNSITHVLAPPIMDTDGYSMGGLAYSGCKYKEGAISVSNTYVRNQYGENRFWHSIGAIAHEIGHNLGARHSNLGLMRSTVLWDVAAQYVPPLASDSRRQIKRCLQK